MKHENGTFTLTKADCKALLAFASRDTTRVHLCGVHFNPAGGCAYATDGHTLVKAQNCGRTPDLDSFTVPRIPFEQAARLLRRKHDVLVVSVLGPDHRREIQLNAQGDTCGHVTAVPVEDNHRMPFPPVEHCIPGKVGGELPDSGVGFNAAYLERIHLIQKAAQSSGVKLWLSAELEPSMAQAESIEDGTTWTAVVMPLRI